MRIRSLLAFAIVSGVSFAASAETVVLRDCKDAWSGTTFTRTCGKNQVVATPIGDLGLDEERDARFRRFATQHARNAPLERETVPVGPFRLELAVASVKNDGGRALGQLFRNDVPEWQLRCLDRRTSGKEACRKAVLDMAQRLSKPAKKDPAHPTKLAVQNAPPASPTSPAVAEMLRASIYKQGGHIDAEGDGKPETVLSVNGSRRVVENFEGGRAVLRNTYEAGVLKVSEEDLDGDGKFDQKFEGSQNGATRVETYHFDENKDGHWDVRRTWTTFNPGTPTESCHDKLERLHKGEWTRERDKAVDCSTF